MTPGAELILSLGVTAAIVVTSGRRRMFDQGPVAYLAIGLTIALPVAQALRNPGVTYPLPSWTMYESPRPPRTYEEFEIVDAEGRVFRAERLDRLSWLPGPLAGYSTPSPITVRIRQLRSRCRCAAGDPLLDDTIASLVAMMRDGGGPAVVRVSMLQHTVSLTGAPPSPTTLYQWNAGGSRPVP